MLFHKKSPQVALKPETVLKDCVVFTQSDLREAIHSEVKLILDEKVAESFFKEERLKRFKARLKQAAVSAVKEKGGSTAPRAKSHDIEKISSADEALKAYEKHLGLIKSQVSLREDTLKVIGELIREAVLCGGTLPYEPDPERSVLSHALTLTAYMIALAKNASYLYADYDEQCLTVIIVMLCLGHESAQLVSNEVRAGIFARYEPLCESFVHFCERADERAQVRSTQRYDLKLSFSQAHALSLTLYDKAWKKVFSFVLSRNGEELFKEILLFDQNKTIFAVFLKAHKLCTEKKELDLSEFLEPVRPVISGVKHTPRNWYALRELTKLPRAYPEAAFLKANLLKYIKSVYAENPDVAKEMCEVYAEAGRTYERLMQYRNDPLKLAEIKEDRQGSRVFESMVAKSMGSYEIDKGRGHKKKSSALKKSKAEVSGDKESSPAGEDLAQKASGYQTDLFSDLILKDGGEGIAEESPAFETPVSSATAGSDYKGTQGEPAAGDGAYEECEADAAEPLCANPTYHNEETLSHDKGAADKYCDQGSEKIRTDESESSEDESLKAIFLSRKDVNKEYLKAHGIESVSSIDSLDPPCVKLYKELMGTALVRAGKSCEMKLKLEGSVPKYRHLLSTVLGFMKDGAVVSDYDLSYALWDSITFRDYFQTLLCLEHSLRADSEKYPFITRYVYKFIEKENTMYNMLHH